MGEPVLNSRPLEAAAPVERPGDGMWRRAYDPQPSGRSSAPGVRSVLGQDPLLEDG